MSNSKTVKCFLLCLSLLGFGLLPFEARLYAQDNPKATLTVNVVNGTSDGVDVAAVAIAQHGDITFACRMFQLGSGQKTFTAKIDVYEVSTEASKITVGTHHLIIKPQDDSVVITEYMLLNNPTDRAISSLDKDEQDKTKVVQIHLPKGFRDLTFEDYFEADAVVVTDDGFHDVMAMPPGEHAAEFSYALDITSETLEITKKFSMPVVSASASSRKQHSL
ncbi:MAG: hypothetical protein J7M40_14160 [Planctomycetes bacterium]|nr:hypothetical protein [Planctomycetota bacterium]